MEGRKEAEFELQDDFGGRHKCVVVMHPASTGWNILLRVVKHALPALGKSAESMTLATIDEGLRAVSEGLENIKAIPEMANSIATIVGALLEDRRLVSEILEHSYRDGLKVSDCFDEAFQGNYGELLVLIGKVLWVNYGPFLRVRLGRLLKAIPQKESRPLAAQAK